MERLQKIIANSGYCSRRKAEQLITEGLVKVNGTVIKDLGTKASYSDTITINDSTLKLEEKEYILLYKPRGVVSSAKDEKGRKTVVDIVESKNRLYPVGRLDYDTSGIILLTNDGVLTNLLTHPKHEVEKVYLVKIDELVIPTKVKSLAKGVIIDGQKTSNAKVKIKKLDRKKKTSLIELTIHEGKNHQVKRMFESLGYEVLKLKRERIAFLTLKGLTSGDYRMLTPKEVNQLYVLSQNVGK